MFSLLQIHLHIHIFSIYWIDNVVSNVFVENINKEEIEKMTITLFIFHSL